MVPIGNLSGTLLLTGREETATSSAAAVEEVAREDMAEGEDMASGR
jgi:hypothetical protein